MYSSPSHVQPTDNPTVVCNSTGVGPGKVTLPIVPIKVRGRGEQQFVKTYALLDTRSTQSFCSEDLTRRLGIYSKKDTIRLTTLEQKEVQVNTSVVHLEVADLDDTHLFSLSDVLSRSQLNVGLNSLAVQEDLSHWPHLRDLLIPDVNIDDVHLLIGQDAPSIMIPTDVRAGLKGEPYGTKTALGWTLNGPITPQKRPNSSSSYFVKPDMYLQHQAKRIDDVHNVGSGNETMSVSQKKVLSIWENSLHRDGVNYTMDIPFISRKDHHIYPMIGRWQNTDSDCLGKRLYQGPDLTKKLIGVLLRFRQERIALMADIEGMFHQVRVSMVEERRC